MIVRLGAEPFSIFLGNFAGGFNDAPEAVEGGGGHAAIFVDLGLDFLGFEAIDCAHVFEDVVDLEFVLELVVFLASGLLGDLVLLGVLPVDGRGSGVGEVVDADGIAVIGGPADAGATFGGDEGKDGWIGGGIDDEDGTRPIGDICGAGAGIHPVAGFPFGGIAEVSFRGMMDEDGGALVGDQERVESISEEGGGESGVFDIAAEIGLKGIDADEVGTMFGEEWGEDLLEEGDAGEGLFSDVDAIGFCEGSLFWGKVEEGGNAGDDFGKVTIVVLGLDGEDFERAGRLNAEGRSADAPEEILLDGGGGFAYSGGTDKEHAAIAAQKAITEESFGGIWRHISKSNERTWEMAIFGYGGLEGTEIVDGGLDFEGSISEGIADFGSLAFGVEVGEFGETVLEREGRRSVGEGGIGLFGPALPGEGFCGVDGLLELAVEVMEADVIIDRVQADGGACLSEGEGGTVDDVPAWVGKDLRRDEGRFRDGVEGADGD